MRTGQTEVHRGVPIEGVVLDGGRRRTKQGQPRAGVRVNQVTGTVDRAAFRVDAVTVVGKNAVAPQRERRRVITMHAAGVLVDGVIHHRRRTAGLEIDPILPAVGHDVVLQRRRGARIDADALAVVVRDDVARDLGSITVVGKVDTVTGPR